MLKKYVMASLVLAVCSQGNIFGMQALRALFARPSMQHETTGNVPFSSYFEPTFRVCITEEHSQHGLKMLTCTDTTIPMPQSNTLFSEPAHSYKVRLELQNRNDKRFLYYQIEGLTSRNNVDVDLQGHADELPEKGQLIRRELFIMGAKLLLTIEEQNPIASRSNE